VGGLFLLIVLATILICVCVCNKRNKKKKNPVTTAQTGQQQQQQQQTPLMSYLPPQTFSPQPPPQQGYFGPPPPSGPSPEYQTQDNKYNPNVTQMSASTSPNPSHVNPASPTTGGWASSTGSPAPTDMRPNSQAWPQGHSPGSQPISAVEAPGDQQYHHQQYPPPQQPVQGYPPPQPNGQQPRPNNHVYEMQ
jgi:hypothetical protein